LISESSPATSSAAAGFIHSYGVCLLGRLKDFQ
jgi:hypothetical protein